MLLIVFLGLLSVGFTQRPSKFDFKTTAPVIGILTQPLTDDANISSVAQSYVGFLEMAGARVVPIHWDSNITVQDNLMRQVNGILFQGGDASLWNTTTNNFTAYATAGCRLLNQAIQMNKLGDYFPVWGTCLGFQMILMCLSDQPQTVLGHFLDTHENHAQIFTNESLYSSFFGEQGSETQRIFQNMRVMHYNHQHGITVTRFQSDLNLSSFFDNLAVGKDDFGEYFVSAIEGKQYPIFGVQFHPEKGPYEWNIYKNFPYIYEAIQSTWHLSNYFVNHTRLSTHLFDDEYNLYHQLIFRNPMIDGIYTKQQTHGIEVGYEQVYLFPIPIDGPKQSLFVKSKMDAK